MVLDFPSNNINLNEAFGKILTKENFGAVGNDIAEMVSEAGLNKDNLEGILKQHGISKIENIKLQMLDLILAYINLVLDDNFLTSAEADNINYLKRFFKIKEGDFYSHRFYEMERLLDRQSSHMYQNDAIDSEEALQKVELQRLFDLGYDQFLKLINKAVKSALGRGAKLTDLDTFIRQSGT